MDKLPQQVKIGLVTYDVVEEPSLREQSMFGALVRTHGRIEILPDMPMIMQEVTLWHECVHEILCQAGEQKQSERIIAALAYGLPRFLRDNPELVK